MALILNTACANALCKLMCRRQYSRYFIDTCTKTAQGIVIFFTESSLRMLNIRYRNCTLLLRA